MKLKPITLPRLIALVFANPPSMPEGTRRFGYFRLLDAENHNAETGAICRAENHCGRCCLTRQVSADSAKRYYQEYEQIGNEIKEVRRYDKWNK